MRKASLVFVPLFVAAIGFMQMTRNPRFEAFHAVDILQLLACGMCLGVALVVMFGAMFGRLKPRETPGAKTD